MIFLNGKIQSNLPIADRSIQYGDGCFTTIFLKQGKMQFLSDHEGRLRNHVQRLNIEGIDWHAVANWMQDAARLSVHPYAVMKVQITRGIGGRGYSPEGCKSPHVLISIYSYPTHYFTWQKEGIRLGIAEQMLGLSPLGGMKHLNRLEQVMLKTEVDRSPYDDLLFCDLNKKLIETSVANVFWRKNKQLYTPRIEFSGVAGIMRAHVIRVAEQLDLNIQQIDTSIDAIQVADEIFITNALMGLVPVKALEEKQLSDFSSCLAIRSRLFQ